MLAPNNYIAASCFHHVPYFLPCYIKIALSVLRG
jgi:hypothetical protein